MSPIIPSVIRTKSTGHLRWVPRSARLARLDSLAAMAIRELASVDGTIAPTAEATIPLKDDGLYRGDGVFEVIRLYAGRPFALAEHLDRLERSAAAIELPAQRAELEPEIEALLRGPRRRRRASCGSSSPAAAGGSR